MTLKGKFFVAAVMIAAIALPARAESASCGEFPEVFWWGKLSHGQVERYVKRKHGGDWDAYLDKWDRQLAKIKDVQQRKSKIVLRKSGIVLRGRALADYVVKVERRVEINYCLADKTSNSAALGRHGKKKSRS